VVGEDGSGANGTLLLAAADAASGSTVVIAAGAGAGGLLALLALLCCLWWLLCLVPRRKRERDAKAKARRPSRFMRAAGKLARSKSNATVALALGLQQQGQGGGKGDDASSGVDGKAAAPGSLVRITRGGVGGKHATAAGSLMYANMNPALLRAKRGSVAPALHSSAGGGGGGGGSGAVRAPRMTMALAAYKKPVAAFKPTAHGAAGGGDGGGRRQSVALLHEAEEEEVDDGAIGPTDEQGEASYAAGDSGYGDGYSYGAEGSYGDADASAEAAGEYDAPAEDAAPAYDAPADADADAAADDAEAEAEDDDFMDEDEPVEGAAACGVGGRAVKGGGYLRSKQKRVAEAAAAPLPPEPKKLVIGRGALITEKVETQVVKLRRVSKIRGDKNLTEMRQAAVSHRFARPSAAVAAGPGFGPVGASSRNLLGGGGGDRASAMPRGAHATARPSAFGRGAADADADGDEADGAGGGGGLATPYAFVATVSRLKVKANTARSALEERRAAAAAESAASAAAAAASAQSGDYGGRRASHAPPRASGAFADPFAGASAEPPQWSGGGDAAAAAAADADAAASPDYYGYVAGAYAGGVEGEGGHAGYAEEGAGEGYHDYGTHAAEAYPPAADADAAAEAEAEGGYYASAAHGSGGYAHQY
jgi:hypothetical protein